MTTEREELAWAAGFFDGEGSMWHMPPRRTGEQSARGGRGQVRLSIQQTDPQVLERFRDAVGTGTVVGPYQRRYASGRFSNPFWNYQAHRFEEAQAVVAKLWTFLSPVKQTQAVTVLLSYRGLDLEGA